MSDSPPTFFLRYAGWNSVKSPHANDWTTLDPAIVSGQVADNLTHNTGGGGGLRSDSPPGWLKNNLDQLTGDNGGRFGGGLNGSGATSGLISGLAGLGLGPQQQPPIGHWGQPSPVMSNTPPPGFALNRGQMGLQPPVVSQPHPFSALAGLAAAAGSNGANAAGGSGNNGGSDRDQIDDLARLVRS